MNDKTPKIDVDKVRALAKLRIVLSVPGMQDVEVRRDVPYRAHEDGSLGMDVYSPPNTSGPLAAVLFVAGFSDTGAMGQLGFRLKEMGAYVSWGQLVAASGLVGITYSSATPPADAKEVLSFVRKNAEDINIDPQRIGLWATSGNGPTALSLLMDPSTQLRFAVMSNTYTLDLDGDSTVADMATQFGFAAPNSGKTLRDIDPSVPIFLLRSGKDAVPGLNRSLDRFVQRAVDSNLRIRFVNLPEAPHSFDILHDTDESRQTIRQIVAFMRESSGEDV